MTIQKGSFADALATGFRMIFVDTLKFGEKPPVMSRVYNTPPTPSRSYVDDSYVTGFGLTPTKAEGQSSDYDDILQGLDKRYTFDTYSLAYRVTQEMVEDELYGIMEKLPRALAKSMRATVETDGANQFNRGFNSSYVGADGVELFSLLHPLVGGGTQKNELTTAADLSPTSYEQALIDIGDTTDDRGILLNLMPKKILYPNELDWTVQQLFGSEKMPDTADNNRNPANSDQLEKVMWNYLTDPDAWFILCDEHEQNWFWRITPDYYPSGDFDTDDLKFKSRARWKRGWTVPWGAFGSPGA